MTGRSILAIDQGTSGTKAVVVGEDGVVRATVEVPVQVRYLGRDGVEVDPEELWQSVVSAAEQAIAGAGPVHAVALANQGETVLVWDRQTTRPLSAALVWQDRRAEVVCRRLRHAADRVEAISGLRLDSYFAAPKMAWLRMQGITDGVVTMTDAWLLARLTGEFVTDAATASRSALLDLDTVDWSAELVDVFGLAESDLPEVRGCTDVVGTTTRFGGELPVVGIAVDQQAALFAEACLRPGQAKCTYGTGAFLLANAGLRPTRSSSGLVGCVAWRAGADTAYCLDGQVYTVGSVVDWMRRIGLIEQASDIDRYAASAAPGGDEVFVPALAGLAAPHWAPNARGALAGLSLGSDRPAIVRAVVEGLAASVVSLADAVAADLGEPVSLLRVDGGLTRSRALMQAQADLLRSPVEVYATPHATALGVAAFARLGLGWVADAAAAVDFPDVGPATTYEPACSDDQAADRLARWRAGVDAVLGLAPR